MGQNLVNTKVLPNHVQTATGETHIIYFSRRTPGKMQELMEWYHEVNGNKSVHPVVAAALFHHKFVAIHPFDDGNGRLSKNTDEFNPDAERVPASCSQDG